MVANRSLISHALDWLTAGGVARVAIVADAGLAPLARTSVAAGWDGPSPLWIERPAGAPLDTSLGELKDFVRDEPFILHLADSLSKDALTALDSLAPTRDDEVVVATTRGDESDDADGTVVHLRDRQTSAPFAGVAAVGRDAHDVMATLECASDPRYDRIAARAEQLGANVRTLALAGSWRLRPGTEALLDGNRFALESLRADHDGATVVNSKIQGPVVMDPSVRVESSLIRGPAIIGPGARIRDAYIGPYTSIGSQALVEGAEVENSILLEGSVVTYLGARLEASIVGAHARLSRDFRLPKALRVHLGEGAEVALT